MNFKCSKVNDMVSEVDEFLGKNKIVLDDAQQSAVNSLYSAADNVLSIVESNMSGLISLLKQDDKFTKILAERFAKISDILASNNFFVCLKECNFAGDGLFMLSLKTLERNLKRGNSSQSIEFVKNVLETNYKKLKHAQNDLSKIGGAILKFTYEFLKCVQTLISSSISEKVLFVAYNNSGEYGDKDKHMKLVSESLKRFCPDKYNLLQKSGVLGRAFDDNTDMGNYSIFKFDNSGKIVVDSRSYTQGIIKNCYFISALRSLSNNPNAVKYLRNCFDKMTDDDLKFANEKTSSEKLNKKFIIGFYDVDFDDLSVDELEHLGLMNKSKSELKCKSTKVYYEVSCKDLMASGIEHKGEELWPLLLEHAWGNHLVHVSQELDRIKDRLPFKHKRVMDAKSSFPEVAEVVGKDQMLSMYANNMYNSIALATLTGKNVLVEPIKSTKLLSRLLDLKNKTIMTVFKGRETDSGEKRSSTKYVDPVTNKTFMLFSGHAVSVKDIRAVKGQWIVELHDTMNSIGNNGIFNLTLEDFTKEFDNIVTAKA